MTTEAYTPILAFDVRYLVEHAREVERTIEAAIPIQLSALWALETAVCTPGITLGAAAEALDLTKQTVQGVYTRLEAAGLVRRESDEANKRIGHYYVTQEGLEALADCRAMVPPEFKS